MSFSSLYSWATWRYMSINEGLSVRWTNAAFPFLVEESISSVWVEVFKAIEYTYIYIYELMKDSSCQRFLKGKQEIKQQKC